MQVRSVRLKPKLHKGGGGETAEIVLIFDNLIFVQVKFLLPQVSR
jgi:hypothetical protein